MSPQVIQFALAARQQHPFAPGRMLEIGSYNVNGTIRDAFTDAAEYIGVDQTAGPGVDRVVLGQNIVDEFGAASFDTVACCEMLEHDPKPWLTLAQINTVLKPGGYLFISTPTFGFPVHRFPKDYYRYGMDAYREVLFEGYEILTLGDVRCPSGYPGICCLGRNVLR